MKYFVLRNIDMPWGDYGDMLFTGLLTVMDDDYNDIDIHEVERAGPYIPEIYKANSTNLVISEESKALFIKEGVTGVGGFLDTIFKKLVNIDWRNWDANAEDPEFFPESGEPIDYIEDGEDDIALHSGLRKYYSVQINESPVHLTRVEQNGFKLEQDPELDVFIPENMSRIVVSEKFRRIVESNDIDTLIFTEVLQ